MAYSAKITPQESPRKFAVMNPKVKNKGVRVGSAAMLRSWGDQECMCRDIRGSSKGVERNNTYQEVGIVWNFDMYNMED